MGHAHGWQIEPVVFGNLRAEFSDDLPPDVHRQTAGRERLARAESLARTLRTVELVRVLNEAGIRALVLKRPAVSIMAYGDFSRRTFADADLLIERTDLGAALEVLAERGFIPDFNASMTDELVNAQHALEPSGTNLHVELHWSLLSRFLRFDLSPRSCGRRP